MEISEEDAERGARITTRSTVSLALVGVALSVVFYAGKMDTRLGMVETAVADMRADVKDITRKVDRVDLRTASMQRSRGIVDEPIADVKTARP